MRDQCFFFFLSHSHSFLSCQRNEEKKRIEPKKKESTHTSRSIILGTLCPGCKREGVGGAGFFLSFFSFSIHTHTDTKSSDAVVNGFRGSYILRRVYTHRGMMRLTIEDEEEGRSLCTC